MQTKATTSAKTVYVPSCPGKHAYYVRKLWINFNLNYGKSFTCGVSIPGHRSYGTQLNPTGWAENLKGTYQIYDNSGYGRPYLIYLSIYHPPLGGQDANDTSGNQLQKIHDTLNSMGVTTRLIIGEANYNDQSEALSLKTVINNIKATRAVFYLLQWPINTTFYGPCGGYPQTTGCDIFSPSTFTNYINQGF